MWDDATDIDILPAVRANVDSYGGMIRSRIPATVPDDLKDDVMQEAYLLLLTTGRQNVRSVTRLISSVVIDAVRNVMRYEGKELTVTPETPETPETRIAKRTAERRATKSAGIAADNQLPDNVPSYRVHPIRRLLLQQYAVTAPPDPASLQSLPIDWIPSDNVRKLRGIHVIGNTAIPAN